MNRIHHAALARSVWARYDEIRTVHCQRQIADASEFLNLEEFYSKLAKAEGFDKERVQQLRALFSGTKKPKTPDVIKALSEDAKESQL